MEPSSSLIPLGGLSLAQAGDLADQMAERDTFVRYRERKAKDTIRRHRADLALFAAYLRGIPGLFPIDDLFEDPFA